MPRVVEVERYVAEALEHDERFRVIVRGNNWLCPFCLQIGARGLDFEEAIEGKLAAHLVGACHRFEGLEPEPEPQPLRRLRRAARFMVFKGRVGRWLERDPRFGVATLGGRWVCPYCVEETGLEWPDGDPGQEAFWGGESPEDSPLVDDVVQHLLRCDGFAQGEDQAQPLEVVQRKAGGGRERAVRVAQARFEQEPEFQLVDQERRWLCPFCAQGQGEKLSGPPDETFFAGITEHLEGCAERRRRGDRPRGVEELRAQVQAKARLRQIEKIRAKMDRHALWRVRDLEGFWYCPYCASNAGAFYVSPDAPPAERDAFLEQVHAHLSRCADYTKPRPQVRSRRDMAAALEATNQEIDRIRRTTQVLQRDARFQVVDSVRSWVCPYCCAPQKRIAIQAFEAGPALQQAAKQVSDHLHAECDVYEEGEAPRVGPEELQRLVREQAAEVSGFREALAAGEGGGVRLLDSLDESGWLQMKADLEAVKTRVERVRQREESLKEARSKQLRLLPDVPEVEGYEFARVYAPCEAVGGDFYSFFDAAPGVKAWAIGDVSGHGIEAALLVGLAKKLLEVHGRERASAAQVLCLANRDLYPDLDERTFVTAFYALLDTERKRLKFSRAGHDPLVLFNPQRAPALQVLDSKGMALGMDPGGLFETNLEELELDLRSGDLILQYTDGVTEAMNPDQEQFGQERLFRVIRQHGHHEAEYVLWKIARALDAFRRGSARSDDVTLIAIKVH